MSTDVLVLNKDEQLNVWDFACKLSKSKMVPAIFQGKPEDTFVTVIMGRELGISPIMALSSIVVIQGTVTLKVQTMNAVVRSKCPSAIIKVEADHENKQVKVTAKRDANDPGYESIWTMEMAELMGLSSKDNWRKQPMNMLKARALSDALRTVFPDILLGLHSEEEIRDHKEVEGEVNNSNPNLAVVKETMSQAMRRAAEEENPIPPEEKVVGPLYRLTHGNYRWKQLRDIAKEDLENYLAKLEVKKSPTAWEKEYIHAIGTYLANYELYREEAEEEMAEA